MVAMSVSEGPKYFANLLRREPLMEVGRGRIVLAGQKLVKRGLLRWDHGSAPVSGRSWEGTSSHLAPDRFLAIAAG